MSEQPPGPGRTVMVYATLTARPDFDPATSDRSFHLRDPCNGGASSLHSYAPTPHSCFAWAAQVIRFRLPRIGSMTPKLPSHACNAHCHVFGPSDRFPYAPGAVSLPAADATKEALFALNDSFGLERCVIVQPVCHGFDLRAMLDAIAARPDRYRGIALLPTDIGDEALRRLDAAGVRGARFNYMKHLGPSVPMDDVLALATRIEPLGWHLVIHVDPPLLTEIGPALKRSPVPVVIDHIGRVDAALGLEQPAFQVLLSLMNHQGFWVKVSGVDRVSRTGPPYDDALPFARRLVDEFGDRVLWGNDWPHPNHAGPLPDEAALVRLIADIAPSQEQRQALLVDNPHSLYRFTDLS